MSDTLGDILFQDSAAAPVTKPKAKSTSASAEPKPVYNTYEDFDYEQLLTYAGIDTYATSKTVAKMFPAMIEKPEYKVPVGGNVIKSTRAPALLDIYQECTGEIFDFICDLELAGINYDVEENRRLNVSMKQEVLELEDRIWTKTPKKINLDSSEELASYLYGQLGLEVPHKTKSGADSTDGAALLLLAGLKPDNPGKYICPDPSKQFLADIAKRKNLVSVNRSFIDTYVDDYVDPDGRIHASYNQFGTSSYRLSASNPSLQNVPRAFGVKSCFNALPGNVFISLDFKSCEFKVLAALCQDEALIAAITSGMDLHSFTASTMYGIPYEDLAKALEDDTHPNYKLYKLYRQNSKAAGFGVVFGSSAAGLALTLGISVDEAQRLLNLYFDNFPKLRSYVDTTHEEARQNLWVSQAFGHRRQYYGADKVFKGTAAHNASLRGSQNYKVQSTTSILGALVFARMSEEIKKLSGMAVATVHDSIELEVPLENASKAIEMCYYYMNDWPMQVFKFMTFPIGSDCECGLNWGSAKHVSRGVTQDEILVLLAKM